ncbi:hypothetical protein BT63DRAFT_369020 [Microthyrium microscopicum]|uniref:Nuclear envelope protein n=1 Tax=Microthyrium microscopicum TaxID=703497 RepID=A0A6A6UME8_9PEZI|nr:hypothetical protein BT63DRAFT_369020 [Microthyrium microscopicum]
MAPPPGVKPRPYRNFLLPALHRQYVHAALLSLAACYPPAVVLNNAESMFWRIVPSAILWTFIVFIVANMGLFLVRLEAMQSGPTTLSLLQRIRSSIFTRVPYLTFGWYLFSAVAFAELYVLSAPTESKLYFVYEGRHNERDQLNEGGIFFRSLFPILAFVQIAMHLWYKQSQLDLPLDKLDVTGPKTASQIVNINTVLSIGLESLTKSAMAAGIGMFSYFAFTRQSLFEFWLNIFRFQGWNFSRNVYPRGVDHIHVVLIRFIFAGFMLTFLWAFTNRAFSAYMVEQPLKKGQPLTNDSKDPNGSLIQGLTERRGRFRSRAFWELSLISNQFEARRKTIFTELDRTGKSSWSQIYTICTAEIKDINARIGAYNASLQPSTPEKLPEKERLPAYVKKTATKDDELYSKAIMRKSLSESAGEKLGNIVKGNSPGAANPALQYADYMLPDKARAELNPEALRERASGWVAWLLRTRYAAPFVQTFVMKTTAIICGSPESNASIIIDAIQAITALAQHSISEDSPGQVQKDLPALARLLAETITNIQTFLRTASPHWTDVNFYEAQRQQVTEVETVVAALREGLETIIRSFGEYFGTLGIKPNERRDWTRLLGDSELLETARSRGPSQPIAATRTPLKERVRNAYRSRSRSPARARHPRKPPMEQVEPAPAPRRGQAPTVESELEEDPFLAA